MSYELIKKTFEAVNSYSGMSTEIRDWLVQEVPYFISHSNYDIKFEGLTAGLAINPYSSSSFRICLRKDITSSSSDIIGYLQLPLSEYIKNGIMHYTSTVYLLKTQNGYGILSQRGDMYYIGKYTSAIAGEHLCVLKLPYNTSYLGSFYKSSGCAFEIQGENYYSAYISTIKPEEVLVPSGNIMLSPLFLMLDRYSEPILMPDLYALSITDERPTILVPFQLKDTGTEVMRLTYDIVVI